MNSNKRLEQIYFSGNWTGRPESLDVFAERVRSFLENISEIHPIFQNWYEKAFSKARALSSKIETRSLSNIKKTLERNRLLSNQSEYDYTNIDLWNGAEDSLLSASFDATTDLLGKENFGWSCYRLILPFEETFRKSLISTNTGERIMRLCIASFEPENAVLTSDKLISTLYPDRPLPAAQAGWIIYSQLASNNLSDSGKYLSRPVGVARKILVYDADLKPLTADDPEQIAVINKAKKM